MGTRSSISLYKDGIVKTIYCHWDGYLYHNGRILVTSYNTIERVEELLSFGDCSSLDDDLAKCEFYGRDRNEKNTHCREYQVGQIEKVKQITNDESQEYDYLFFNGGWYFIGYCDIDDGIDFENWTPLTLNLCK
jgi:hypothetical protein